MTEAGPPSLQVRWGREDGCPGLQLITTAVLQRHTMSRSSASQLCSGSAFKIPQEVARKWRHAQRCQRVMYGMHAAINNPAHWLKPSACHPLLPSPPCCCRHRTRCRPWLPLPAQSHAECTRHYIMCSCEARGFIRPWTGLLGTHGVGGPMGPRRRRVEARVCARGRVAIGGVAGCWERETMKCVSWPSGRGELGS